MSKPHNQSPESDNAATNPLQSAPDGACVVGLSPGHVQTPLAHTSIEEMNKARNAQEY